MLVCHRLWRFRVGAVVLLFCRSVLFWAALLVCSVAGAEGAQWTVWRQLRNRLRPCFYKTAFVLDFPEAASSASVFWVVDDSVIPLLVTLSQKRNWSRVWWRGEVGFLSVSWKWWLCPDGGADFFGVENASVMVMSLILRIRLVLHCFLWELSFLKLFCGSWNSDAPLNTYARRWSFSSLQQNSYEFMLSVSGVALCGETFRPCAVSSWKRALAARGSIR